MEHLTLSQLKDGTVFQHAEATSSAETGYFFCMFRGSSESSQCFYDIILVESRNIHHTIYVFTAMYSPMPAQTYKVHSIRFLGATHILNVDEVIMLVDFGSYSYRPAIPNFQ